ncbi:MAG: methyltransferase [bacterium]
MSENKHKRSVQIAQDEVMDDLLHGELKLVQHRKGYRYSVDALLLASFALRRAEGKKVLDMGAGTGVIALILACRAAPARVAAVELQPGLADLARKNVKLNQTSPPVEVFQEDAMRLDNIFPPAEFDLVVSNPPFRSSSSGRVSSVPEKALARHEIMMSIETWLKQAGHVVGPAGSICLVYPVDEQERLEKAASRLSLWPARKQYACDRPGGRKKLMLVELRSEKTETRLEPEVPIETESGRFSLDGYK